jgi:DivIVA domain-containing protein
VYQPAAESGQDNPEGPPAFRMVWRGYDREEVDAYLPQLIARLGEAVDRYAEAEQAKAALQRELTSLREESLQQLGGEAAALLQEAGRSAEQLVENARRRAETIIEKAQQQAEQIRADGTNEAQTTLQQAREVADQLHREVEQERAALHSETEQVHEFRNGLVDDLGRVHLAVNALLERIGTRPDQPLTADPQAATAANGKAEKPPEARKVPEQAKVAEPD